MAIKWAHLHAFMKELAQLKRCSSFTVWSNDNWYCDKRHVAAPIYSSIRNIFFLAVTICKRLRKKSGNVQKVWNILLFQSDMKLPSWWSSFDFTVLNDFVEHSMCPVILSVILTWLCDIVWKFYLLFSHDCVILCKNGLAFYVCMLHLNYRSFWFFKKLS